MGSVKQVGMARSNLPESNAMWRYCKRRRIQSNIKDTFQKEKEAELQRHSTECLKEYRLAMEQDIGKKVVSAMDLKLLHERHSGIALSRFQSLKETKYEWMFTSHESDLQKSIDDHFTRKVEKEEKARLQRHARECLEEYQHAMTQAIGKKAVPAMSLYLLHERHSGTALSRFQFLKEAKYKWIFRSCKSDLQKSIDGHFEEIRKLNYKIMKRYLQICGNFSDTYCLEPASSRGLTGDAFMFCIHTENANQEKMKLRLQRHTKEYLEKYKLDMEQDMGKKFVPAIDLKLLHEKHSGIALSRFQSLEEAKYEWISGSHKSDLQKSIDYHFKEIVEKEKMKLKLQRHAKEYLEKYKHDMEQDMGKKVVPAIDLEILHEMHSDIALSRFQSLKEAKYERILRSHKSDLQESIDGHFTELQEINYKRMSEKEKEQAQRIHREREIQRRMNRVPMVHEETDLFTYCDLSFLKVPLKIYLSVIPVKHQNHGTLLNHIDSGANTDTSKCKEKASRTNYVDPVIMKLRERLREKLRKKNALKACSSEFRQDRIENCRPQTSDAVFGPTSRSCTNPDYDSRSFPLYNENPPQNPGPGLQQSSQQMPAQQLNDSNIHVLNSSSNARDGDNINVKRDILMKRDRVVVLYSYDSTDHVGLVQKFIDADFELVNSPESQSIKIFGSHKYNCVLTSDESSVTVYPKKGHKLDVKGLLEKMVERHDYLVSQQHVDKSERILLLQMLAQTVDEIIHPFRFVIKTARKESENKTACQNDKECSSNESASRKRGPSGGTIMADDDTLQLKRMRPSQHLNGMT